jgi:hypothetical protein
VRQLQSRQTFLNTDKIQLAQHENALVGANLSAWITNLRQSTIATDAIPSTSGQILSSMNLLNFLK